jgi:hypothetical protein
VEAAGEGRGEGGGTGLGFGAGGRCGIRLGVRWWEGLSEKLSRGYFHIYNFRFFS